MNILEPQKKSIEYILSTQRDAQQGNGSKLLHRGQQIKEKGGFKLHQYGDNNLVSYVAGSNGESYRVAFLANGTRQCNCAFEADCKHLVAVGLYLEEFIAETEQ